MKKPILSAVIMMMVILPGCGGGETAGFTVQNYVGNAWIQSINGKAQPEIGGLVTEGSTVITGDQSYVDLEFNESALIRVNENSSLRIDSAMKKVKDRTEMTLDNGSIYTTVSKLKKDEDYQVMTRTMVVAVRGTSFRVSSTADAAETDVLSGAVTVNPVEDGRVVKDVSNVVEENNRAEVRRDEIKRIIRERKLAKGLIRADRLERFRRDLDGIDSAVVDRLNPELRHEFRVKVLRMRREQFEQMEQKRGERMEKFLQMKKDRGARINKKFMERRSLLEKQKRPAIPVNKDRKAPRDLGRALFKKNEGRVEKQPLFKQRARTLQHEEAAAGRKARREKLIEKIKKRKQGRGTPR